MMKVFVAVDLEATGRNIDRLRREAGLKVTDIQEYFGFTTPQAYYKWRKGICLPTVDNLVNLAALFGVNLEDILIVKRIKIGPKGTSEKKAS